MLLGLGIWRGQDEATWYAFALGGMAIVTFFGLFSYSGQVRTAIAGMFVVTFLPIMLAFVIDPRLRCATDDGNIVNCLVQPAEENGPGSGGAAAVLDQETEQARIDAEATVIESFFDRYLLTIGIIVAAFFASDAYVKVKTTSDPSKVGADEQAAASTRSSNEGTEKG